MVNRPGYQLQWVLLCVALMLNFNLIIWDYPIILVGFLGMMLLVYDFQKFWWGGILVCFASMVHLIPYFPRMANHCNLEVFIVLVIFSLFALKIFKPLKFLTPDFVSAAFRISLITIYFYTGFHKLNYDFFNTEVSCVNGIHEKFVQNFSGLREPIRPTLSRFFQLFTLCLEIILPFGLLWQITRRWIIWIFFGFHFYLSFIYYFDFTGFAIFILMGTWVNYQTFEWTPSRIRVIKWYAAMSIIIMLFNSVLMEVDVRLDKRYFISGILLNLSILLFLFEFFKKTETTNGLHLTLVHRWMLAGIVLLINLWAFRPYLGLGNTGNLTMFSNLITEKSRNNHILINTNKTKLTDLEEDLVLILKIHHSLKGDGLENFYLPLSEFNFRVAQAKSKFQHPIPATIVYANDTLHFDDITLWENHQPKWWQKFITFRKIPKERPCPCLW